MNFKVALKILSSYEVLTNFEKGNVIKGLHLECLMIVDSGKLKVTLFAGYWSCKMQR